MVEESRCDICDTSHGPAEDSWRVGRLERSKGPRESPVPVFELIVFLEQCFARWPARKASPPRTAPPINPGEEFPCGVSSIEEGLEEGVGSLSPPNRRQGLQKRKETNKLGDVVKSSPRVNADVKIA